MNPESRYLVKDDFPQTLYLKEDIIYETERPIIAGFSDVFRAHFAKSPTKIVAVKRLRYTVGSKKKNEQMDRALEKEITALMRIQHPCILGFVGLVKHNGEPCVVTPWAKNGAIHEYLEAHPSADREKMLREVASAILHLHSGEAMSDGSVVVHGDIHTNNVLVGADGTAMLCDFGLCKLIPPGLLASLSDRRNSPAGMIAFVAPELHDPGTLRSVQTDVFSFGMLVYHVLGGDLTKLGGSSLGIVVALMKGTRPARIADVRDEVWKVAEDCWKGPSAERPSMKDVCARLQV